MATDRHLNTHSGSAVEPPHTQPARATNETDESRSSVVLGVFALTCCGMIALPLLVVDWRRKRQAERKRREEDERARQAWIAQQEHARVMALQAEHARQMAEQQAHQMAEQQRRLQAERAQREREREEEQRRIYVEQTQRQREQEEERRRIEAEKIRVAEEAKKVAERERRDALIRRFGEKDAAKIIRGELWLGATAEAVLETLGVPADSDEKVLKTKKKETWKYHSTGKNRYRLRVMLENGIVVGWEDKS
ncbi:MAG: hypothetical protein IPM54_21665 [Polyangiaceae bacterium]|nr:hypothetical protein [Polyangiaceae bacterium]